MTERDEMNNTASTMCAFLGFPDGITCDLRGKTCDEPIIVHVYSSEDNYIMGLHLSPECASRLAGQLMGRVAGHDICAACGIYKPLSGDIHCIDCDKKMERAHEAEER